MVANNEMARVQLIKTSAIKDETKTKKKKKKRRERREEGEKGDEVVVSRVNRAM